MTLEKFFDESARKRVEAAVKEAEARSLGEIVPVVVEKSSPYATTPYRGALIGAIAVGIALSAVQAPILPWEMLVACILAAGIGAMLATFDPIERALTGRSAMRREVNQRARLAFLEHELQKTRAGTGVLLFVSLFEHEAIVLGDKGIDAKMGPDGWQHTIAALVAGLRKADPATGFCDAIHACGDVLAKHFPRTGDDHSELPDHLRVHAKE